MRRANAHRCDSGSHLLLVALIQISSQHSKYQANDVKKQKPDKKRENSIERKVLFLFLIPDCRDQEKHWAASFVLHARVFVQHFLRRLRFGESCNGEIGVK